jgi:hypothetical protein
MREWNQGGKGEFNVNAYAFHGELPALDGSGIGTNDASFEVLQGASPPLEGNQVKQNGYLQTSFEGSRIEINIETCGTLITPVDSESRSIFQFSYMCTCICKNGSGLRFPAAKSQKLNMC